MNPDAPIQVSLTPRQLATIKVLFGELHAGNDVSGVYASLDLVLPEIEPCIDIELSRGVASVHNFLCRVDSVLTVNGYTVPTIKEVI